MVKQQWRKRTHGTSKQKGKAFILGPSQQRLKSNLPKLSGRRHSIERPTSIHEPATSRDIEELHKRSIVHAKESPEDYAKFVSQGIHGIHKSVEVSVPSHKVDLSLKILKVSDLPPADTRRKDFEQSVEDVTERILRGQTIAPILVHRLPSGKYEIIDGNARLQAYRRLGIQKIPVVENGLGEVLSHIGSGIWKGAKFVARTAGRVAGAPAKLRAEYERGKAGKEATPTVQGTPPPPPRGGRYRRVWIPDEEEPVKST